MRYWHRCVSIFIFLPFLITVVTGILLATRAFNPWMQPEYSDLKPGELKISFSQIIEIVRAVPQVNMKSWADISQIDARPKTGQIRVRSKKEHWEVQIDGSTGEITGVAKRRVAWFTSLHEGAFWGETIRYFIFLPSAFGVFFLSISGAWIFFQPYIKKWRAQR